MADLKDDNAVIFSTKNMSYLIADGISAVLPRLQPVLHLNNL